jgi:RimJ/RimL family protein N-acetyltransferase
MSKIMLRALTIADIDKTLKWHNLIHIQDNYLSHPFPVNMEMERKWYDKILTSNIPITVFGIEYIANNELIGITVLKEINFINRSSEFGIYIGEEKYNGKGLAKEATLLTLRFAFYKLGLNRVFLKVIEDNITAIELYKSVGFKNEGLLRQSVFKNNSYKNEIIMSILNNEFNG